MVDVEYNGIIYPSVEHAFQAGKFTHSNLPQYALKFASNGGEFDTAVQAKSAGGRK